MAAKEFIVAIELGSSKITGIAGKKNNDGSIQVQAFAHEESSTFMRKGVVYNIDKTTLSIQSIIKKLESSLNAHIEKVYVGVGGQSMRSIKNIVTRHLEENVVISQELIDAIMDDNREVPYADQEILDVAPQEYKIGNSLEGDPVGIQGSNIEGRFLNIIARTTLKENIYNSFEQANLEVADLFLSPLVTAETVLTDAEKRSGCALIDFGAETTTVSVYNKNVLRHLAVIPLGSKNITKDICSLSIEEDEAEELKKKYGVAFTEQKESEDDNSTIKLKDGREIEVKLFNEIVEARTEEIIVNILNQIRLSGYEDKLLAGIIITGGGSNLKDLDVALKKNLKEKMNIDKDIKIGKTALVLRSSSNELQKDLVAYNTVIGLMSKEGNENCCAEEVKAQPVQTNIFENQEQEIKKQNEEAKKQAILEAEKAEKAKKEAEELAKKKAEEKRIKRENSLFGKMFRKVKEGFNNLSDTMTNDE